MKRKIAIFPMNGNGLEALDCLDPDSHEFVGFIDDDPSIAGSSYPVYSREMITKYSDLYFLAVPGGPSSFHTRSKLIRSLKIERNRFITLVHPKASVGVNVKIGFNTLIMAGVVITSNAFIGNHVCILPNSVIHHDSVIEDYTMVGSNVSIAGSVVVERNSYIGSGSNIINGVCIGRSTLVGLGSNIIRNVDSNSKMVGNPARNLKLPVT